MMYCQQGPLPYGDFSGGHWQRGKGGNRNGGDNRGKPKLPKAYCWTHGLCKHTSKNCKSPMDGHCKEVTLENRMGGSQRGLGN